MVNRCGESKVTTTATVTATLTRNRQEEWERKLEQRMVDSANYEQYHTVNLPKKGSRKMGGREGRAALSLMLLGGK